MVKDRKQVQAVFLTSLATDPSVTAACDAAGISRDTVYRWRSQSTTFEKLWDEALIRTQDRARSSIYQRGIIGRDEPLTSAGQPVYEIETLTDKEGKPVVDKRGKPITTQGKMIMVRKYSDSLAALYAKANLPEYKEKTQIEHSGTVEISSVRERIAQKVEAIKQAKTGEES